ncbi:Chloride channel protein CLC-d [Spatholobus suberectus]|nr:Chloride channel protein CLC-d [Spatholobus suberectus]
MERKTAPQGYVCRKIFLLLFICFLKRLYHFLYFTGKKTLNCALDVGDCGLRAIHNGVDIDGILLFRTLIGKIFGSIGSVGRGLLWVKILLSILVYGGYFIRIS